MKNMSIKNWVGLWLLAAPVVGYFVFMAMQRGFWLMLAVFATIGLVVGMMLLGLALLGDGRMK